MSKCWMVALRASKSLMSRVKEKAGTEPSSLGMSPSVATSGLLGNTHADGWAASALRATSLNEACFGPSPDKDRTGEGEAQRVRGSERGTGRRRGCR